MTLSSAVADACGQNSRSNRYYRAMTTIAATILVVEDDDALRQMIAQTLIFDGFRVLSAGHGAEALRIMNTTTPALVVLDLVLPWVNGLEVLATMRGTPRLRAVPVLVVTGT